MSVADQVAECVQAAFNRLPRSAHPRTYTDGKREWVPLSGIVIYKAEYQPTCVALGTGMRCLPASKVPLCKGNCLHDWHAEVVALRAFNYYLLSQCLILVQDATAQSDVIQWRVTTDEQDTSSSQPFEIRDDITISMYCSEAPCGDASMELTMASQEDETPWQAPATESTDSDGSINMVGRGYFSRLGIVRRKPARPDAPPTLSKSCSDKIAMKQCTSTLSSMTSILIHPRHAYIDNLVVPESQYIKKAFDRCFSTSGRMGRLLEQHRAAGSCVNRLDDSGFKFWPVEVLTTASEFEYCRRHAYPVEKARGTNVAAMWTPTCHEVLINGGIQGHKQFHIKGQSRLSRAAMWRLARTIADSLVGQGPATKPILDALIAATYAQVKCSNVLASRNLMKAKVKAEVLTGWQANADDSDFSLS